MTSSHQSSKQHHIGTTASIVQHITPTNFILFVCIESAPTRWDRNASSVLVVEHACINKQRKQGSTLVKEQTRIFACNLMTLLVRGEAKSSSSLRARELDDPAPHPLQQDLHFGLAIQAVYRIILSPWSNIFHQRKAYKHWYYMIPKS